MQMLPTFILLNYLKKKKMEVAVAARSVLCAGHPINWKIITQMKIQYLIIFVCNIAAANRKLWLVWKIVTESRSAGGEGLERSKRGEEVVKRQKILLVIKIAKSLLSKRLGDFEYRLSSAEHKYSINHLLQRILHLCCSPTP